MKKSKEREQKDGTIEVIPTDCPESVTSQMIAEWWNVSVQTVHRWAETGVIPPPIRLGPKVIRWDREQLREAFRKAQIVTYTVFADNAKTNRGRRKASP